MFIKKRLEEMPKKTLYFLLLILFLPTKNLSAGEKPIIRIFRKDAGEVNKLVYGSSILGWRKDNEKRLKGNVKPGGDFGYGVWDPIKGQTVKEVKRLGLEAGIKIFRLIGMWHNWTEAVDIPGEKRKFMFGIDEQMKVCSDMGADVIVCISYIFDNAKEAEEIIRYLNGDADQNLIKELNTFGNNIEKASKEKLFNLYVKNKDGTINWANLRAINGHIAPYQVKYFEIGNETWYAFSPEKYADVYLQYYEKLKKSSPEIKIGAVFYTREWNEKILKIIKEKIDFGIYHIYPTPVWGEKLSTIPAKDIFNYSLILPEFEYQILIRDTLGLLEKYTGKKVPLAITEFNGGFVQEKPTPYRHCLGTALINAELIKVFMRPENNILLANCWNFINEYWGMLANGFNGNYVNLNNHYCKRPNFYTLELYNKHFGDILLEVKMDPGKYAFDIRKYRPVKALFTKIKTGTVIKGNLLRKKWIIRKIVGIEAEEKEEVLEIEFNNPGQFNYFHSGKQAKVEPNTYYKLSGYIKTENLVDDYGVCLEIQDAKGWTKTHSAASTEKISGDIDWHYVDVVYETQPDAELVNVIARRIGNKGPLKGRALFKDIRLEKFIPSVDTLVPYLSVNASRDKSAKKVYIMVINKNQEDSITSVIVLENFTLGKKAEAWILNGPSIDATNEQIRGNVGIKHIDFDTRNNSFEFIFEPHSLTAIELEVR